MIETIWIEGRVYSYDIDVDRISARHERVTFTRADSNDVGSFDVERLRSLPHPWLVLEDTHCNIYELLKFFDGFLTTGDYVLVEDTPTGWTTTSHGT